MSGFRHHLEKEARRQQIFVFGLIAFFAVVGTALALGFFMLKTTVINITPLSAAQEAVVTVNGGAAVYVNGTLFSLSRAPSLNIESEGFQTINRVIARNEEGGIAQIQMRELPARLTISVLGTEDAVAWTLNGRAIASAKSLDQELAPGEYEITAEHRYFEPATINMVLERGKSYEQEIALQQVEGELQLRYQPEDALVFLDGKPVSGLVIRTKKPAGKYEVRLEKEGYAPITEEIEITNRNRLITREYQLQKNPAYLNVEVSPTGGKLTLNGKTVRLGQRLTLAAGKLYLLRYQKNGYNPQDLEVRLKPGEETTRKISLDLNIGEVRVNSTPSASVLLDGKPVGDTPLTLRLPAVTHKISFVKKGYRSVTKTIVPSSKSAKRVEVKLLTEKAAKLAEAKPKYVNSVGMEMVLFAPGPITLGAPRHEPGQRANEFVRSVNLTRHFYAAATEVTEAQFARFQPPSNGGRSKTAPVSNVAWNEAALYANWLSKQEGLSEFYKFDGRKVLGFDSNSSGYRLLTEAEWEWLARKAGRRTQTRFTWGDDPVIPKGAGNIADETANGTTRFYVPDYVDGYAGMAPVKSFGKEKSGLYDIFGNVSEWVHDYYSLVPPARGVVQQDPLGSTRGDQHMYKGASWSSGTLTEIRPAYRAPGNEGAANIGFRVGRYLYGDSE